MANKLVPAVDLVSGIHSSEQHPGKVISSADILQQALDETDEYGHRSLNRLQNKILQENIQHLTDHSYIHSATRDSSSVGEIDAQDFEDIANLEITTVGGKGEQNLQFETDKSNSNLNREHLMTSPFTEDTFKVDNSDDVLSMEVGDNVEVLDESALDSGALVISENPASSVLATRTDTLDPQFIFKAKNTTACPSTQSSGNFTISLLKQTTKQSTAPLGSVGNPIQIIQNGNSYHSTQLLSQAQLQQISHVLQQQQAKKFQDGGKSVMFDPSTNTRIVCRVVNPTEASRPLENNSAKDVSNLSAVRGETSPRGRGRPKRPGGRRRDEDEKLAFLSKEEREEKKKHRPRTRSGRISKPPSYMVKDYKRIHHLDFDEEPLNDSDGGYSDYHVSDEEGSGNRRGNLPPGVSTSKHRNYSCPSCNKAYIGRGGLSRHYRLYPTHGRMPEGEDVSTQDENSNSSLASSILSSSGGYSNNQNNSTFVPHVTPKFESEAPSSTLSSQLTAMQQNDSLSERRKLKLREILKNFSEGELIDVALPKIAQSVPLWDFFSKQCDEKSNSLRIFEMLKEFEKFLAQMQRVSHEYLSPASLEDDQGKTIINISSKQIAEALSLQTGAYFVKDSSSSAILPAHNFAFQSNTIHDLIIPHTKRKRVDHQSVEDISAKLPEQILSHEDVFPTVPSDQHDLLSTALSHAEANSVLPKTSLFDLGNSTTVTPSSLSSGCLSAVDSSKPSTFFATDGAHSQILKNIQVRKVQLLGSDSQQHQLSSHTAHPISTRNGYTESSDFSLGDLAGSKELAHRPIVMDESGAMANTRSYETMNLNGADISALNSCQEVPQTIGLHSTSSLLQSLVNVSPVNDVHSILNRGLTSNGQIMPSRTEVLTTAADCLPLSDAISENSGVIASEEEGQACLPSSNALVASREIVTHSELISEAAKPTEASQVLRHLMLPDGQVIGVWSQVDSADKSINSQLIQNFMPGNLIILQNPDGSLQVPSNQNATLETLQTLVSVEPAQTTQTFTTV